ncbi:alpha/beta hydrolase family protein [Oleidesulfovibrio sp.]|uniref:alpha/beta hydrolase family protein n=1 Tax=Oleidesulfovibrio sp. TaxID=2909707 RepID=UPI003A8A719B
MRLLIANLFCLTARQKSHLTTFGIKISLFFAMAVIAFIPCTAKAAGSGMSLMHVGFKLLSAWDAESGERIEVGVWYPSTTVAQETKVGERTIKAAREGAPELGRFPTILLSHVMAGSALAHHDTAETLAQKGFVIIAPTHRHDNVYDTRVLFSARHVSDRVAELATALDFARKEPELGAIIDNNRLGAIGFDTGAAAVLIMAGGIPAPGSYADYCTEETASTPYCSQWAARRLQTLTEELGPLLQKQAHLPRLKAAALVAPGYAFMFGKEQLANINIPIRLMKAENDTVNPGHADILRESLRVPPLYSVLESADNFTLRAPCPRRLEALDKTMCQDKSGVDRKAIHAKMNSELTGFFLGTLGTPVSNGQ